MHRAFSILIGAVVLGQLAQSAYAGTVSLSGREPNLWRSGMAYLIVARVTEVQGLELGKNDENATHLISLEPLSTVAGTFDPSKGSQIKARAYIGTPFAVIQDLPSKGAIVLALIEPGNIGGDDARPFPCISPDICHFMPNEQGLFILKGLDDPLVHETLERIRKERAAGESEAKAAEKRAQSQPTPNPDSASEQKPRR
jgi:hypothetical protein